MSKLDLDYFETLIAYKSLTDETYLASIIDYIKPIYFKNKDNRRGGKLYFICIKFILLFIL